MGDDKLQFTGLEEKKYTVCYRAGKEEPTTVHVMATDERGAREVLARYLGTREFVVTRVKQGWSMDPDEPSTTGLAAADAEDTEVTVRSAWPPEVELDVAEREKDDADH